MVDPSVLGCTHVAWSLATVVLAPSIRFVPGAVQRALSETVRIHTAMPSSADVASTQYSVLE